MKSTLYLCAGERLNPIIETQVFRLLHKMGERRPELPIHLLLLANVSLRHPLDSLSRLWLTFSDVKRRLSRVNLNATFYPLLYPFRSNHFYMRFHHLTLFLLQTLPILMYSLVRHNPSMIHARSYPACVLALLTSRLLRIPYVFDMRGLYPEEGIVRKAFSINSVHYRIWKNLERKMIEGAQCVVVESHSFKKLVRNISESAEVRVIPVCVDIGLFAQEREKRGEYRHKYCLTNRFVVVYCGSLGWNDPQQLAEYYSRFRSVKKDAHLLILTFRRYNAELREVFESSGLHSDLYTILNPSVEEVPSLLSAGDVGLLLLKNVPTAKKALTVKFAEYLAAGLPVIVSDYAEGAAHLVKLYRCGIVIDSNRACLDQEIRLLKSLREFRNNGLKLANSYLSLSKCAERYLKIYES